MITHATRTRLPREDVRALLRFVERRDPLPHGWQPIGRDDDQGIAEIDPDLRRLWYQHERPPLYRLDVGDDTAWGFWLPLRGFVVADTVDDGVCLLGTADKRMSVITTQVIERMKA